MALLWLPALTAYAGTYSAPVYSGGTYYGQGYQGPGTQKFGPVSTSTGPGWGGGSGGVPSATAGGAITATFTWQPDPKLASDPPPSHILVTETSSASGTALCAPATVPGTVSCNDGIGPNGAVSTTNYPGYSVTTSSCQDVRRTLMSNKQTVTVTCSPQVSATGNQSASSASVSYSASIQVDSRAVTISCPTIDTNPNGGSTYRDPPLTGSVITNVRSADGTLRGDTVLIGSKPNDNILGTTQSFTYHATPSGSWASLGAYHWYSSLTGYSYSGSWPNLNDFTATLVPDTTISGSIDHVFLSMYDGVDNAEGTGNYYTHFHNKYEPVSWPSDGAAYKVMGPDPDSSSFASPPPTYPWQLATDQNGQAVPPLIGPQGSNAVITFGGTKTQGGHVDGGLGIGKDVVNAQFGGGYDWSKSSDYSISINPTPAVGQGKQTWAVCRLSVNRSKGHLDIYGTHGYTGTGIWYKDDIVTTDYSYFQPYASTTVAPFTPAPGWNPPGYN